MSRLESINNAVLADAHVLDHRVHVIVNRALDEIDEQDDRVAARAQKIADAAAIFFAQVRFGHAAHEL